MVVSLQIELIKEYFVNKFTENIITNQINFIYVCDAEYDEFWISNTHIFCILKFINIPEELLFVFVHDSQNSYGEALLLKTVYSIDNDTSLIQNDHTSLTIIGRQLDYKFSEERMKLQRISRISGIDYEAQLNSCNSIDSLFKLVFKPNKKMKLKFTKTDPLNEFKLELSKSVSRYSSIPQDGDGVKEFESFKTFIRYCLNSIAKTNGEIPAKNPYPNSVVEKANAQSMVDVDSLNIAIDLDGSHSSSCDNGESGTNDEEVAEMALAESPFDTRNSVSQFVVYSNDAESRLPRPAGSFNRFDNSQFHSINYNKLDKPVNQESSKLGKSTWMTPVELNIQLNKRNNFRNEIKGNLANISRFKNLNIRVLSWNINSKVDSSLNLDEWILPKEVRDTQPDIFVFGFQEVDLSIGSVALNKTSSSILEDRWVELIESACNGMLKRRNGRTAGDSDIPSYKQLKRVRMAGILLIIYMSNKRRRRIIDVAVSSLPTGIMNMMGNKGAVAIRFNYYNSSFCFINCHLAAGEGNLQRRKQDISEIMQRLVFNMPSPSSEQPNTRTISDHDYQIVLGDLNFRLITLSSDDVLDLIENKAYKNLLAIDEIRTQPTELSNFREAEINFPPTYKYVVGTQRYDVGEKGRIPAYCDRILYKGEHICVSNYSSHHSFVNSDHKPVSAMIRIGAYRVNRNHYNTLLDKLIHRNDIELNRMVPKASVEPSDVELIDVEFFKDVEKKVLIRNTGNVDLEYEFKNDNEIIIPDWLTVSPRKNVLKKGESNTITITVCIKDMHVQRFNKSGGEKCFLIVRLQDGGDSFISLRFKFKPTCFGLSLKMLNHLGNTPFGKLSPKEVSKLFKECEKEDEPAEQALISFDDEDDEAVGIKNFHIPKEIYRMTNFIIEHVNTPYLYDRPQNESLFYSIQNTLNNTSTNEPFPETVDVCTMIAILNIFLSTIEGSMIPAKFQQKFLAVARDSEACIELIKKLPIFNQNLVFYLLEFLRCILKHSSKNGSNSEVLAKNYAEIFFKDENYQSNFDLKAICVQNMIEYKKIS